MQCIILAGGLATRLGSLTEARPKALLPVAGRPFCDHQVALLRAHGVTEIVYCIGHLGGQIRAHFRGDERVRFVDEGSELRGTGGALRLAFEQGVLAPQFLLLYGDSYLPIDYLDVFEQGRRRQAEVLMTVCRNNGQWDKSNAQVEGDVVTLYSKSEPTVDFRYIDYGLTMFDRSCVNEIVEKSDLAQFFERMSRAKRVLAYEVSERFYEVGSTAGIRDLNEYLGKNQEAR